MSLIMGCPIICRARKQLCGVRVGEHGQTSGKAHGVRLQAISSKHLTLTSTTMMMMRLYRTIVAHSAVERGRGKNIIGGSSGSISQVAWVQAILSPQT